MNVFLISLISAFAFSACDNNGALADGKVSGADTLQLAPVFTNGVTDANKGTRKGVVELKGTTATFKQGKVYLWETQGRATTKIDSASIAENYFSFGKKEYEQGVYMVGTNENNMCPIIINPSEGVCEIGFKNGKFETGLYAINSRENEGWAKYTVKEPGILSAIKDARVSGAKSPGMKMQFEQQAAAKELELSKLQGSIINEYPNTHLAKLLTWKQEPWKTDIAKYWDNIDFSDESVIRSRVITDRIESFMRAFSKGEESGFINCVATVAERAKANEKVLEFTLNQMLSGFYESNMETLCMYIIDNYVNGDACGDADLSNVIKSTAESIQNLSLGKTPPDFSLNGLDGKNVNLFATASKNKYTLVMFWSSWCEHCKGEAPEVKACYNQWHEKGFEIIGVSIDKNKVIWENAVKERGFIFPNVCGMKEYQSPVAKDYRVTRTPTFILLDGSKKIVLKPKGIKEVQAFLSKNMQ